MGEIRTVKGRERERATAVERVVVTPLREGHCCGASRRNPAETEIARKMNAQTASQQAWYVRIGCIRGAACAVYPPNCGHPSVALLDRRRLIARTHAMVQVTAAHAM
jgi:hypothetical protein